MRTSNSKGPYETRMIHMKCHRNAIAQVLKWHHMLQLVEPSGIQVLSKSNGLEITSRSNWFLATFSPTSLVLITKFGEFYYICSCWFPSATSLNTAILSGWLGRCNPSEIANKKTFFHSYLYTLTLSHLETITISQTNSSHRKTSFLLGWSTGCCVSFRECI